MRMDFCTFLPSNACTALYPDNATSHYTTLLPKRVELTGHWKVALLQVHYPNTISHVTDDENEIVLTDRDGAKEKFRVKTGHYSDIGGFLYALHEALTPIEERAKGDGRESRVDITIDQRVAFHPFRDENDGSTVTFSPRLAQMLGLGKAGPFTADERIIGQHPIDLSLGIPPLMFIYLDKITNQIVGDCEVPLLAAAPINTSARTGRASVYSFDHPMYFDLATKSFDTIEVNIRDHAGKHIAFNYGTLMLLCHFKRAE